MLADIKWCCFFVVRYMLSFQVKDKQYKLAYGFGATEKFRGSTGTENSLTDRLSCAIGSAHVHS